ncbi:hypothetical protein SBA2_1250003 [Acidobacteriia bacterium SbA2]|nr:hypothetical protein SBA2_1250003 [Acidobacteriia bacterium SbA2]
MMAIWVIPLPCGPPTSGVMPTSAKARRNVSRFDPQIDAWSISRVVLLLSGVLAGWVIAFREISKRTSAANDKRQQIGELRVDMRASLSKEERGMVRQNARSGNRFWVGHGFNRAARDNNYEGSALASAIFRGVQMKQYGGWATLTGEA